MPKTKSRKGSKASKANKKRKQSKVKQQRSKSRNKKILKQPKLTVPRSVPADIVRPLLILDRERWGVVECGSDGNCLFNSICFLLEMPIDKHMDLRKNAIDTIEENLNHYFDFYQYADQNINDYLKSMRNSGIYAGEFEVKALSDHLKRRITIFQPTYIMNRIANFLEHAVYGEGFEGFDEGLNLVYYRRNRHYRVLIKKEEQINDHSPVRKHEEKKNDDG